MSIIYKYFVLLHVEHYGFQQTDPTTFTVKSNSSPIKNLKLHKDKLKQMKPMIKIASP